MDFKKLLKTYFGGRGEIKNFSSKELWVVETEKGYPIAHRLLPKHKTPKNIDADAFRRFDEKAINGHKSWWKIWDYTTANVYNYKSGLRTVVIHKTKVNEKYFAGEGGKIKYDKSLNWGIPIKKIIGVLKDKKGIITNYYVEGYGWLAKTSAVRLAVKGLIDNAVPVFPSSGTPYLRSPPDDDWSNNLLNMR